jgi:hypothetical protein
MTKYHLYKLDNLELPTYSSLLQISKMITSSESPAHHFFYFLRTGNAPTQAAVWQKTNCLVGGA